MTDTASLRAPTGDPPDLDAAFARLVAEHSGVVFSVALRLCGQPADAEDLAADTFLRAYRALRGYDAARRAGIDARPWLLRIVVNTRRNQVRDAARRPRAGDGELPERPAPGPSVEEHAENADLGGALGDLLARLPETQRTAVVLRHVVDLPVDEVAAVLGCPTGTAKSHVSRGLARLRTLAGGTPTPATPSCPPSPAATTTTGSLS